MVVFSAAAISAAITAGTLAAAASAAVTVGISVGLTGLGLTLIGYATDSELLQDIGGVMSTAGLVLVGVGLAGGAMAGALGLSAKGTLAGKQAVIAAKKEAVKEGVQQATVSGVTATLKEGAVHSVEFVGGLQGAWAGGSAALSTGSSHIFGSNTGTELPADQLSGTTSGLDPNASVLKDSTMSVTADGKWQVIRDSTTNKITASREILTPATQTSAAKTGPWVHGGPPSGAEGALGAGGTGSGTESKGMMDSMMDYAKENPLMTAMGLQGLGSGIQGYAQSRSANNRIELERQMYADRQRGIHGPPGGAWYRPRPTDPAAPPDEEQKKESKVLSVLATRGGYRNT